LLAELIIKSYEKVGSRDFGNRNKDLMINELESLVIFLSSF